MRLGNKQTQPPISVISQIPQQQYRAIDGINANPLGIPIPIPFHQSLFHQTIAFRIERRGTYRGSEREKKADTVVPFRSNKQTMMGNSKNCGRRSLGLGVLVISQILCLAQADGNKSNGWDNVLDRIKSDLNSNGGADKPSSVLRGTERELKHSVSGTERIRIASHVLFVCGIYFFLPCQISDLCSNYSRTNSFTKTEVETVRQPFQEQEQVSGGNYRYRGRLSDETRWNDCRGVSGDG